MRKLLVLGLTLGFAATAMADYLSATAGSATNKQYTNVGAPPQGGQRDSGIIRDIDISGVATWDLLSDPSNVVMLVDLGALKGVPGGPVAMTGIGWDTTQTATGASWLSEMSIYFDDNIAPDFTGLFLSPGAGYSFPGTASFSSGGVIKLADYAIPDVNLPNGIMRLEFFEGFDDVADAIDGIFEAGSLLHVQCDVPEPASLALLGVAGLLAFRRR